MSGRYNDVILGRSVLLEVFEKEILCSDNKKMAWLGKRKSVINSRRGGDSRLVCTFTFWVLDSLSAMLVWMDDIIMHVIINIMF